MLSKVSAFNFFICSKGAWIKSAFVNTLFQVVINEERAVEIFIYVFQKIMWD